MHLAPGYWAADPRLYHLECTTLTKAGYHVELAANGSLKDQVDGRVRFHSVGEYGNSTLSWRLFQRIRRDQQTYALARRSNAALYHYHSLEFIMWGRRLRRLSGRPVIFDCREDFEGYARQRRGIPDILRRPLARFVRNQLRVAAHYCDAIIVADRGTANMLRPYARRLLVLHNFPRLDLFLDGQAASRDKPYDIVYHGTIPKYHLEVCLAVDAALMERGRPVRWRLIGNIPERDWLFEELTRRGIQERFYVTGLIPHDQIAEEVRKAKLGIIPLPDLPKFQNNLPQKLFEFMALGMPVVLSDLPPSRPFVGDGGCAIMVPPGDHSAYADAIIKLLDDPDLCRKMGAEGRRRVEQEYNWEKESQKLLDLYTELLGA